MRKVLVTGGAGYIGSHTVVALIERGFEVVVVDNFCNSSPLVLPRMAEITGVEPQVVEADLLDRSALDDLFSVHQFDAVVHFAGLKAVGESVQNPLLYYKNNVAGSLNLFAAMQAHICLNLVFSSSATVYGDPDSVPIKEDFRLSPTNPYGRTKLMVEEILADLGNANPQWRIALLRYFNPVGAHPSGSIGEMPNGTPNNLMPYITQVAAGTLQQLSVFGDDYPTKDGTGVRDYIHVMDLAAAHLAALLKLPQQETSVRAYNIGTGVGYSVLQMIDAFETESGVNIPYTITNRRPGDIAECYADCERSKRELGWRAHRDLVEMMRDQWRWQSLNPQGYR
ncbi:MAG: UDP-glucose 4-epimerase GalE [Gammaproteobacteria bacterium]|nr:UDP-glucose 4-epimerase GalE [Gammaproteobacteria bacterium]